MLSLCLFVTEKKHVKFHPERNEDRSNMPRTGNLKEYTAMYTRCSNSVRNGYFFVEIAPTINSAII